MRLCPRCESGYPDSKATCPVHGEPLVQTGDLPPGILIGGAYRILGKLGQGSMGTVYLVEHEREAGEVKALKLLSPELSGDEMFTSRFERAAKRLSDLRHPNVLRTTALQRAEDGSLFFAMEHVDGPSLRVLLHMAPDPFEVGMTLAIIRCLAEGLGAAHAAGMIHLDLKPQSILMARDTKSLVPKITHFGIGATQEFGNTFLAVGRILLTPTYAAPEQWLDTRPEQLDGRTDLYALGAILFEMLTHQTVFDATDYHGWARQHVTVPPRIPSALRPELTAWRGLDDLVRTLLAKNVADRPRNASAVIDLLDAVQFRSRNPESPQAPFVEVNRPIEHRREQEQVERAVGASQPAHIVDPKFKPPMPEFLPPAQAGPTPVEANAFERASIKPTPIEKPPIVKPPHFVAPEFRPKEPEFLPPPASKHPGVFKPAMHEDENAEEPTMSVEELKRLFGRTESSVKIDDAPGIDDARRIDDPLRIDDGPRRTPGATSIFGPPSTGLPREEWPSLAAAPKNFFGQPYVPADPEEPTEPTAEVPPPFNRTEIFTAPGEVPRRPNTESGRPPARPSMPDWMQTGKFTDLSPLREAVGSPSSFPKEAPVPEIDFRQQYQEEEQPQEYEQEAQGYEQECEQEAEQEQHEEQTEYSYEDEEEESGSHPHLGILIVLAAFLLIGAAGFVIWRFGFYDSNTQVSKLNAACAQGDGKACYDLGSFYEKTTAVSDGDERATAVYSQACELNFPLACRKLGLKYLLGTGIARDINKAMGLFAKACDKADFESCDNLANIYHEGKGVPVDDKKAAELYNKACTDGDDFGCKWAAQLAPPAPKARPSKHAAH